MVIHILISLENTHSTLIPLNLIIVAIIWYYRISEQSRWLTLQNTWSYLRPQIIGTWYGMIRPKKIIIFLMLVIRIIISLEKWLMHITSNWLPIHIFEDRILSPHIIVLMVDTLPWVDLIGYILHNFSTFLVTFHQHFMISFIDHCIYLRCHKLILIYVTFKVLVLFQRRLASLNFIYCLFLLINQFLRAFCLAILARA